MATWVYSIETGYDQEDAKPVASLMLSASDPIYNFPPLFIASTTLTGSGGTDVYATD